MGMMLAAEPAEPDIMERRPRRPGKRLLGKLILWRCAFVSGLIVILVLGVYGEFQRKTHMLCWAMRITGPYKGVLRELQCCSVMVDLDYFLAGRHVESPLHFMCSTRTGLVAGLEARI